MNQTFDRSMHNCPSCEVPAKRVTPEELDGICQVCHKQPGRLKQQRFLLILFCVITILAGVLTDWELAHFEKQGGERRFNLIVGIAYDLGGRIGAACFWALLASLFAGAAYGCHRRARRIEQTILQAKKLGPAS